MAWTPEENAICEAAKDFARKNKKRCIELSAPTIYLPEEHPVSVFMAGSPGAGKTEASKELIQEISPNAKTLRIDPDDLRSEFPGYNGRNSRLFQPAISIWVDRMLDLVIKNKQSFLLDGTLSNLDQAKGNVRRSLRHERTVQLLYVYQDPILAWQFVQAREIEEGRSIPRDTFIEQYFAARDVVNALKAEFGGSIKVDLLLKPNDGKEKLYKAGIDRINYHVPERYDRETLARVLA